MYYFVQRSMKVGFFSPVPSPESKNQYQNIRILLDQVKLAHKWVKCIRIDFF